MSITAIKQLLLQRASYLGLRPATTDSAAEALVPALSGPNGGMLVDEYAPSTHTAITPSDATDLTAIAPLGVIVSVAGSLAYRLAGAPTTTVTLTVVAGQYVPGRFTRVMAATTATVVGVAP
jgi:hypothetical protein